MNLNFAELVEKDTPINFKMAVEGESAEVQVK